MFSPSQRIWGYETPDGSFSQFTRVQAQQLMPRPKHLTWEESACYTLTLATAYPMLLGHEPHELKPGMNVLVWGASGGLGSYAIQLINTAGANAIAFGDFRAGYTIAERPDLRVLRDPFSAKPHVLFYATKRVGGDVSDFAAIKLLKFAVS